MLNWAGFGLQCAATDFKLGSDLVNIGRTYLNESQQHAQIGSAIAGSKSREMEYGLQAESFRRKADDAVKQAGRVQEQGRQMREERLVKLGQDKGHIIAGASGSGIDVSSKVVGKVLKDTMKSAMADIDVIAENERQSSKDQMNAAASMRINAIYADSNANIERMNQDAMFKSIDLIDQATKVALVGGYLSAAANWASGMAKAGQTLTSGSANVGEV